MQVRLLGVLVVSICSLTVAVAQEKPASRLKEFAPKQTKFKLLMPGEPVETDTRVQGMKAKTYRFDEKTQGYAIMVLDLPEKLGKEDTRSPEARLEAALAGGLWFTTPSTEAAKKVLLADKYPGLESTVTLKGDERSIRMRTYLIDNQIVHLIAMGKPAFLTAEEANQFFNSLQVGK